MHLYEVTLNYTLNKVEFVKYFAVFKRKLQQLLLLLITKYSFKQYIISIFSKIFRF